MMNQIPTIAEAKALAKKLRAHLESQGRATSHAQALETVAHQHGYRDWNTFCAVISAREEDPWEPGMRVQGTYLAQPFKGSIIAKMKQGPGWFRLVLDLDEPVDVVMFEGFSNYRRRIRGIVGPDGHSRERTSNGVPHLRVEAEK